MHSHPRPSAQSWESLKTCGVKKWAAKENTAPSQCFPNDCSVVWQWSRRLLGLGPTHLRLGSSLSSAIWASGAIVSLMWQLKLGCFYLSSSDVKTEEDRHIPNTSWYTQNGFSPRGLNCKRVHSWTPFWHSASYIFFNICQWFSCRYFMGEMQIAALNAELSCGKAAGII